LVIGADGYPLRKAGSVTRNLHRVSQLVDAGCDLIIIGEAEFLRRVSDIKEADPIRREHTLEQLSRLLGISGLRLRRWIEIGLIQCRDDSAICPTFDYRQVATAKTLSRMINSGIAPSKLANSLKKLQRWLPDDCSLRAGIVALENQLLVRRGDVLIDSVGQLHFSFTELLNESDDSTLAGTMISTSANTLFDLAFQYEKDGNTD